jgi:GAF domain
VADIDPVPRRVHAWRWLLPALCVLSMIADCWTGVSFYGIGGRPQYGYWDAVTVPSTQPFVAEIVHIIAGGTADRAGIQDGDRIDVRDLGTYDRAALLFQPVTTVPVLLVVRRGSEKRTISVVADTVYDGNTFLKLAAALPNDVAEWWILGCALLLALRRWQTREGRYLCLGLLSFAGAMWLNTTQMVSSNGTLVAVSYMLSGCARCAAALLPVVLARRFGVRSPLRALLVTGVCALAALELARYAAATIGLLDASIDPLPLIYGNWLAVDPVIELAAVLAVGVAVASTPRSDRARAAWLLLPLPIALVLSTAGVDLTTSASTWVGYMALYVLSGAAALAGAAAVTYALLRRRVLDFDFVVSRTLVVATVSALVVGSFALLEWLLGTVLAGVSHATGWIANGALALTLGLMLNPMQKRVDVFIDLAFFRKRHEDERALLDFSKEAAYVTDADTLLDQALDKLRRHTDACDAAILIESSDAYAVARCFGEASTPIVDENDPAILALKAWHRPLDPHRYGDVMRGALALPMLARGRLLGAIVLGERAGGEAYAPDEIEALSQLAHGVGSALDTLALHRDDSMAALREVINMLPERIAVMLRKELSANEQLLVRGVDGDQPFWSSPTS